MDWQQQLDEAVGDPGSGAADPDLVARQVLAGRRALRRRRAGVATAGLASVAVVAVLGGTLVAPDSPDSGGGRDLGPAESTPTRTPSPTATPDYEPYVLGEGDWPAAMYDATTGRLDLAEGWTVTRRIEDPITLPVESRTLRPSDSVGLELSNGGRRQWVLTWTSPADGGSAGATHDDAGGFLSLDDWLAVQVAREQRTATDRLVRLEADGELTPLPGVRLREQQPAPELGTGVVVARLTLRGQQWMVVARPGRTGTEAWDVGYPYEGQPNTLAGLRQHLDTGELVGWS